MFSGCLDRSKVLTAREYLYKNPKLLRAARKSIRKSNSRQKHLEEDNFQQTSMEAAETEMGSTENTSSYDYEQSARFPNENLPTQESVDIDAQGSSPAMRKKFNKRTEIPLQGIPYF